MLILLMADFVDTPVILKWF